MVTRLNDHIRDRDIDEATKNIDQLNAELERTEVLAVRLAMQKLIEANVRRRTLANTRADYVFRIIDPAMPVDSRDYYPTAASPLRGGRRIMRICCLVW